MDYVNFNINCSKFKSKMISKFLIDNNINFIVTKGRCNQVDITIVFKEYGLARNLGILTEFLKNKNIKFVAKASDLVPVDLVNY